MCEIEAVGDAGEGRAVCMQSEKFVVSRLASVMQHGCETGIGNKRGWRPVHGPVHDNGRWRIDHLGRLPLLEHRLSGSVQRALLSTEHAFDNIRQVLEHVKAISHLHGRRGTASDSFGVGTSPVAGNELDR
jgi:hypothetical protein